MVEFVLVASLLMVMTLAVLQLALSLHVRNTVQDAAAEGARFAALADGGRAAGAERTDALLTAALGADYDRRIGVGTVEADGHEIVVVTVQAPLPVIGMLGVDGGVEVSGRAPVETLG